MARPPGAQASALGWAAAPSAQQSRSMSVSITPGLSGTAAMPAGNSAANA